MSDNNYSSGEHDDGSLMTGGAALDVSMTSQEHNAATNVARPLVTARGTYDGLILRLDGKAAWSTLREALVEYIDSRRDFFAGNPASVEWLDEIPSDIVSRELKELLKTKFSMEVTRVSLATEKKPLFRALKPQSETVQRASTINDRIAQRFSSRRNAAVFDKEVRSMSDKSSTDDVFNSTTRSPSLFDGVGTITASNANSTTGSSTTTSSRTFVGLGGDESESRFGAEFSNAEGFGLRSAGRVQQLSSTSTPVTPSSTKSFDSGLWDDPDTRLVFATLRSGERIETEHSLVVFGDVNPGAEIVAGGDIVVLGVLRGTAHAGAYEESGGGRVIFALNLQPTQLRIGSLISRGGTEGGGHSPEVAKIENASIVVQPYSSRQMGMRRR